MAPAIDAPQVPSGTLSPEVPERPRVVRSGPVVPGRGPWCPFGRGTPRPVRQEVLFLVAWRRARQRCWRSTSDQTHTGTDGRGSVVNALMTRRVRRAAVLLLAGFASACSPAPTAAPTAVALSPSPSAAAYVTDSADFITFERPADWIRSQPNLHVPEESGPLVYLGTQPLLASCAVAPSATPHPADSQGLACQWPLTRLAPDGVLVVWGTTRIMAPRPTSGSAIAMNGGSGRLLVERPGACQAIGGDDTISVWVPMPRASATLSNVTVFACLRGPDLATSDAQVRRMLASASVGG